MARNTGNRMTSWGREYVDRPNERARMLRWAKRFLDAKETHGVSQESFARDAGINYQALKRALDSLKQERAQVVG